MSNGIDDWESGAETQAAQAAIRQAVGYVLVAAASVVPSTPDPTGRPPPPTTLPEAEAKPAPLWPWLAGGAVVVAAVGGVVAYKKLA